MVPSKDEEVLWVFDFVCKKQADGLKGLLSSIHVITEEKVVRLRWKTSVFKQAEKIIILPMDIAADLYIANQCVSDEGPHQLDSSEHRPCREWVYLPLSAPLAPRGSAAR